MIPNDKTVDTLCRLLQEGDEADRCYAARTLGVLKNAAACEPLMERLRDKDIDVCVDAATALGNIGDPEVVPALIESLENESSGEIATAVTEALGKIGDARAIDALLKVVAERPEGLEWDGDWDTWWDVQLEAVKALGVTGDSRAVDALISILDDEEQQDIEHEILRALVLISGSGLERVIERLQIQSQRSQPRRRSARALGHSDSPLAAKALGRALTDKEPDVRAEAALALARMNAGNYLSALLLLLRDADEGVRRAAIKSVTQLSGEAAYDRELEQSLLSLLKDPSSRVRATLFNTLLPLAASGSLSGENFQAVLDSISDRDAEAASAACTLLGEAGNPAALAALLSLLADPAAHPMVRREAALSIGKLGIISHEVVETLTRAVGDGQQAVRLAALTALMALERDGQNADREEAQAEAAPARPLQIIIEALEGKITLSAEAIANNASETRQAPSPGELREQQSRLEEESSQSPAKPDDALEQLTVELKSESQAERAAGNVASDSLATQETDDEPALLSPAADMPLPENEPESAPALSTLDAIALDNVEQMLQHTDAEEPPPELDETAREYLQVVEENKETMRRIRSNRHISPGQDVRRLAARTLGELDDEQSLEALIQALSDDDSLVRQEATQAIGEMARINPQLSKLSDAVGTLITLLAMGDLEQKVCCARTLGSLGNRTALVPLVEALKDPHANVRVQAIEALACLAVNSMDPKAAGHMVVRDMPPMRIARQLLECLEDQEMSVRVAAARGLATVLPSTSEKAFVEQSVQKIVSSVSLWTGEEARLMGRILRSFDPALSNETLLKHLESATDSMKRSVVIEMIEELLNPDRDQPEQAA